MMESQYVTLQNDLRIHFLVDGDPASPPLVLLHGYPSSCQLWRHCIPALAQHFRVYAPDLPGYGRSDKPLEVDYDLDFFVDFLLDFYDVLGLEQADLVVHDFGGMIGLGFAARYPARVARLVVMDTVPYAAGLDKMWRMMSLLQNPWIARCVLVPFVFRQMMQRWLVHDRAAITPAVAELYRAPWVQSPAARRMFRQVVRMPPERVIEPRENLANITMPTLILWAREDRVLPALLARRLHRDLPDSRLEIVPQCGHFLQEENPQPVIKHLLAFLNGEV